VGTTPLLALSAKEETNDGFAPTTCKGKEEKRRTLESETDRKLGGFVVVEVKRKSKLLDQ